MRRVLPNCLSGIIVFLVSIPLCLGISLAAGAPIYSGLISGVIGGILVGLLSSSSVSVSGPAAGITAIILMANLELGSFANFLLALTISGCIQIAIGKLRLGFFADYIPSSVIKGMLSAIGMLLILKMLPLASTFSHNYQQLKLLLVEAVEDGHLIFWKNFWLHLNNGAILISSLSLLLLIIFEKKLKKIPGAIIVVLLGTAFNEYLVHSHPFLAQANLVNLPIFHTTKEMWSQIIKPNFLALSNPLVYFYAFLIACVSSLETLVNISATERLDKVHRMTDKSKELFAQGVGNFFAGLFGGLPITSAIIQTSVNVENKANSKLSTITNGILMLLSILLISKIINRIPLSVLASILIFSGYKLTCPSLYYKTYKQGHERFIPFIVTVLGILFINLLSGIILGLILNLFFVLRYNSKARVDIIQELYPTGVIKRLVLPQQTSFLNKSTLISQLNTIPNHAQLIIDARSTNFIDKEIIELIEEYKDEQAPQKNISLNLIGFKDHYTIQDHINFINVTTYDAQSILNPDDVLNILKQGNERFLNDKRIHRSNMTDVQHTAKTQHPIAVVLGCIDSRVPVETIFDMTFGDLFCIRIAGNVVNNDILASIEYACHVVGAKLIVVLGHTGCGAINAACNNFQAGHITELLQKINPAIETQRQLSSQVDQQFIDNVTNLNINNSIQEIGRQSTILSQMLEEKDIGIIGAIYDISSGKVNFF